MSDINSVIVFGPTGQTGLQVLKRGILEGLEVTAFVRRPQRIPANISAKLFRVIQGDIFDKERVEDAIEGHDAVISALGTGWGIGPTTIISTGCRNMISGMKKHNVKKIAVVSDALRLPAFRWHPLNLIFWNIQKDHQRQLDILQKEATSLDWVVVMPPKIVKSDDIHPRYKKERDKLPGKHTVTTAELGDFLVKVVADRRKTERFRQSKVGISSPATPRSFFWRSLIVLLIAFAVVLRIYGIPDTIQEFMDEVVGTSTTATQQEVTNNDVNGKSEVSNPNFGETTKSDITDESPE